jgi:hypothetical protein
MDTMGRIRAKKHRTYWTGCIIPNAAPQDWFIETFPDQEALLTYAATHNLTVEIIEDDGENDNEPER